MLRRNRYFFNSIVKRNLTTSILKRLYSCDSSLHSACKVSYDGNRKSFASFVDSSISNSLYFSISESKKDNDNEIDIDRSTDNKVLFKYFTILNSSDSNINRRVDKTEDEINQSIEEAISLGDTKILKSISEVCLSTEGNWSVQLDQIIRFHLTNKNLSAVYSILKRCHPEKVQLPNNTCCWALSQFVGQCHWQPSFLLSLYMIHQDHQFPKEEGNDKHIFFTIGALMKDSAGVSQCLELLQQITLHRRSDLIGVLSFTKLTRYNQSMNSGGKHLSQIRPTVKEELLLEVLKTSVEAARQGWVSFTLSKTLLAIAIAAGQPSAARDFARYNTI